jgi:hypothetical protein
MFVANKISFRKLFGSVKLKFIIPGKKIKMRMTMNTKNIWRLANIVTPNGLFILFNSRSTPSESLGNIYSPSELQFGHLNDLSSPCSPSTLND